MSWARVIQIQYIGFDARRGKVAQAVAARILAQAEQEPDVSEALSEADMIIDATASLVASRSLSDFPVRARPARLAVIFASKRAAPVPQHEAA